MFQWKKLKDYLSEMNAVNHIAQMYSANADTFDIEQFHHLIVNKVKSGEYETCLEAIADYLEKNDIDVADIETLISPALRQMLYKEALEKNLLLHNNAAEIPESLFV